MGLLDSGASRTVINENFGNLLKILGFKSHFASAMKISTADGTVHNISGIFDIPVQFDGHFHFISMMPSTYKITFKNDNILSISEINCRTSADKAAIVSRDNLSGEDQKRLSDVITEMKKTIGVGLGRTVILNHTIDMGDNRPCYQKPYNFSPIIRKQLEYELNDMLSKDVVKVRSKKMYYLIVLGAHQ